MPPGRGSQSRHLIRPRTVIQSQILTLIVLTAFAMLVRVGQAMLLMGQSHARDVAAAGVRTLLDITACILGFSGLGAAWLLQGVNLPAASFFFVATVQIAAGAATSSVAERSRLLVGPWLALIIAAGAFPLAARWSWFGGLAPGSFDAAGAGAVHLLPGTAAILCALLLGPRTGKFNRDGSSNLLGGHSLPLSFLGVLLMLVGWVSYIVGTTLIVTVSKQNVAEPGHIEPALLVSAAMNTMLAAGAAMLVGAASSYQRIGRIDPWSLLLALLGGLVSVTAGAPWFNPGAAMAAGGVAGLIVPLAAAYIDMHLHIDDPLSASAVHGIGGLWALIAAGLFAPTLGAHRIDLMKHQLAIAAACIVLGALAAALVAAARLFTPLRKREEESYEGLDLAEHDINAYPDFQQNLIRSYHLRER
jgi:Amt family ammonium transporter